MRFLKNLIKNDSFKEVLSGSFASFITKAIGILLNYFLIFYISNKIGVASVGFYNIILISLFLATILCTGGLNYAIIPLLHRFSSNKTELYSRSLSILSILLLIAGLLIYLLSPLINNSLFSDFKAYNPYVLILLVALYVFQYFNIEYIRGNKNIIVSESLRNIVFPLVVIIGIIFSVSSFQDYFNLILFSIFAATIITLIPSIYFALKSAKNTAEKSFDISKNTLLKTATPLMIMGLSSFSLSEASLFFLKYYYDIKAVGDFTIIYKISITACLVFTIAFAIIGPKIAELFWSKKTYELRKLFVSSLKMIFFATLPVFIVVLFFPSFFLSIFNLSADFTLELIIMLVGQFLYGITAIFGLFLMVTDKQKIYRNIYIVSAILNLILCFVLIPKYGVLGASITVAISYVFLNILCIYSFYKRNLLV
ncbi:hypothetical protein LPB136_10985 [Tenacibaculum todarodis]|uniref:Uncharacterized protein n=1 Tax=Tenacibaculum todarodis TaxID=1850252 RepID=A0A1L3JL18_9FLAO|nr:polysaccharide biosynthesis C-terminal domain-containing protein [Tenacibaculum todarodis]APG65856.1 hypothetical protein LPB136_10985 [Tenacibaculum todarodis]